MAPTISQNIELKTLIPHNLTNEYQQNKLNFKVTSGAKEKGKGGLKFWNRNCNNKIYVIFFVTTLNQKCSSTSPIFICPNLFLKIKDQNITIIQTLNQDAVKEYLPWPVP